MTTLCYYLKTYGSLFRNIGGDILVVHTTEDEEVSLTIHKSGNDNILSF